MGPTTAKACQGMPTALEYMGLFSQRGLGSNPLHSKAGYLISLSFSPPTNKMSPVTVGRAGGKPS